MTDHILLPRDIKNRRKRCHILYDCLMIVRASPLHHEPDEMSAIVRNSWRTQYIKTILEIHSPWSNPKYHVLGISTTVWYNLQQV